MQKVDESLKADIIHWAAIYVCPIIQLMGTHLSDSGTIGKPDASRKQKNISSGGLGSQGDVVVQG